MGEVQGRSIPPQGLIRITFYHVNLGVKCCQECDPRHLQQEDQFKCGMTKNVSSFVNTFLIKVEEGASTFPSMERNGRWWKHDGLKIRVSPDGIKLGPPLI